MAHIEKLATFCEKYADDLQDIEVIGNEYLPQLTLLLAETYNEEGIADQNNTGVAEAKANAKQALVQHLDLAVAALLSYADDVEDVALAAMIKYPISAIAAFNQWRLVQFAHYVLRKLALPDLLKNLEINHNYSANAVTALELATEAFLNLLTAPQEIIIASKIAG